MSSCHLDGTKAYANRLIIGVNLVEFRLNKKIFNEKFNTNLLTDKKTSVVN